MKKNILLTFLFFSLFFLVNDVEAKSLGDTLSGRILLQVENNGEAWYVNPKEKKRVFLKRPKECFNIMRDFGLGIQHQELNRYLAEGFPERLSGKILLDVEKNGEAYYVYPVDKKGYYLGTPKDAFNVMRTLGLGISNKDLNKIETNVFGIETNTQGLRRVKWDDSFSEKIIEKRGEYFFANYNGRLLFRPKLGDSEILFGVDPYSLEALGDYYYRTDKNVYCVKPVLNKTNYNQNEFEEGHAIKPVYGVNKDSFKDLGDGYATDGFYFYHYCTQIPVNNKQEFNVIAEQYSTDKTLVFFRHEVVFGADLETFEVINQNYAKDKNHIYYQEQTLSELKDYELITENYLLLDEVLFFRDKKMIGVDTETFTPLNNFFSKDKNQVYTQNRPLALVDHGSFDSINPYLFYDKDTLYYLSANNDLVVVAEDFKIEDFEFYNKNFLRVKDKVYTYSNTSVNRLNRLDVERVEVLSDLHIKDDENVYTFFFYNRSADAETFKPIFGLYSMDKNNVYYRHIRIAGADKESFEVLNEEYAVDKNNFYTRNLVEERETLKDKEAFLESSIKSMYESNIANPDIDSFQILSPVYAKDSRNVYQTWSGTDVLEGLNSDSFKVIFDTLHDNFGVDETQVYYSRSLLKNLDPKKITLLGKEYIRDDRNIYFGNVHLEGADVLTFEVITNNYSKDKNNVYQNGKKTEFDSASFKVLGDYYFSDKTGIFYGDEKIVEVDRDTFEVLEGGYGDYSRDKNNVYFLGKKIIGADPESFEYLYHIYSRDKDSVYMNDKINSDRSPSSIFYQGMGGSSVGLNKASSIGNF